ncbi:MAG: monooxygenase, partial [Actinomadura rubrobrunea]|nr:monooxygenase [Actinomadura rubrobrunea]
MTTATAETENPPRDHDGWIARARETAAVLAADAPARDRAGGPPF